VELTIGVEKLPQKQLAGWDRVIACGVRPISKTPSTLLEFFAFAGNGSRWFD
jgi:hypothetical protein